MKHKMIFQLALSIYLIFVASLVANAQFGDEFKRPTYSHQDAANLVKVIYFEVLERKVDDGGLVLFSGKLADGKMTVQEVVRAIGVSPEYAQRFIKDQTPRQAVVLMYRHLLLREPESQQVIEHHVNEFYVKGWQAKVLDFINSPEAAQVWEKFTKKTLNPKPQGSKSLNSLNCKFFLGRQNDYLCPTREGFDLCETMKKDNQNVVKGCHLAGVNEEIDKALISQGCIRTAVGQYSCRKQQGFDACENYKKNGKGNISGCKRLPNSPIKIDD